MSGSVDRAIVRRWRALPPDDTLGWTPYLWLIYLTALFVQPALSHATALTWALTVTGVAVFLASYFRSFWACTTRERVALTVLQCTLGAAFAPWNVGAPVLFVYAAGSMAQLENNRRAMLGVGAVTVAGALVGMAAHQSVFALVMVLVIAPLIGAATMHQAQMARTTARLRAAHEEIRRLAAVAERERISRDLHDVLGHTLSLIVLKSELAAKLAPGDVARAVREIRDVECAARAALADVRKTISGYRPGVREELERARLMLEAAAIDNQIEAPSLALAPVEEEALAFAIREGVTNIVRHSGARRARIVLAATPRAVTLEIADDGTGSMAAEGGGLRGMRDRMSALGGSLSRDVARGTRLVARLPRVAA